MKVIDDIVKTGMMWGLRNSTRGAYPMRNEYVEMAVAELDRHGLRAKVNRLAKHIEIGWDLPNGEERRTVVPTSGSDWRGVLNARADLRRMLRKDNVQPVEVDVRTFNHAMSLPKPKPPVLQPTERLDAIEGQFLAAVDWLAELQEDKEALQQQLLAAARRTQELEDKLSSLRVTVSFDGKVLPFVAPAPTPSSMSMLSSKAEASGPSARILDYMRSGAWVHGPTMKKDLGLEKGYAFASTLQYLRVTGRVEHGQRGYWRLKPDFVQGSAAIG